MARNVAPVDEMAGVFCKAECVANACVDVDKNLGYFCCRAVLCWL